MGRSPGLLLLCASVAWAQAFSGLATNRDGSVLYFSSAARLKGTSQYPHEKIFRWDAAIGFSLFEERPNDYLSISSVNLLRQTYFSLRTPDVSADGSTVSFVGFNNCWSGSVCLFIKNRAQTSVYSPNPKLDPSLTLPGLGALSPNGRYVGALTPVSTIPRFGAGISVIDRQTGKVTDSFSTWPRTANKRWIANDGTFVFSTADGLALATGGEVRPVPNSSTATFAMINDAADVVLFERPGSLAVFSFKDGASRDLFTGPVPVGDGSHTQFAASLSYDGSQIVFIYEHQVYVVGSDGKGLRQITRLEQGIVEVALSGDGAVAFASTADGRIVRIDVATGDMTEIVPPTPFASAPLAQQRGHVQTLTGAGFATESQQATAPYPLMLNGVELRVQGAPIPLAAVGPSSISYAVPWDFPETPKNVLGVEIWTSTSNSSPFISGFEGFASGPEFALFSAIHEDFSSLVAQSRPAKPGEIIHLYARDLGPVAPAPSPAMPVPAQPLSVLVTPLTCFLASSGTPLHVVFVGLAPTMVDVFQIDLRIPASSANTADQIACQVGGPGAQQKFLGVLLWVAPPLGA